jgi:protein-disulfide isomerase
MMAEHPGRIRLSVRHVPFHPGSGPVVAMLEASRKQGKYWQALEALLGSQGLWVVDHVADPAMARQVMAGVGLDLERLAADMAASDVAERMAQDRRDAAALNVSKTPEYFVNGRQMQSFGRQQLQGLIRDAVKRAY